MHNKMYSKTGGALVLKSLQNVTHNAHKKHWYIKKSVHINWHRRLHAFNSLPLCADKVLRRER